MLCGLCAGFDLAEQPRHPAPSLWMHRQHVDDVGPIVASPVAVTERLGRDRVAVGLVPDQDAAERVSGLRIKRREQRTKVFVVLADHD
jgi:hypothetical protein